MRRLMALALVAVVVVPPAAAQECGDRIDEASFATEETLAAWNQVMSDLGSRPTGSPAHEAFISWIESRLAEIPGLEVSTIDDTIERWLETGTSLKLGGESISVAGAVPYSTASTVSGELAYVPPGTAIADAEVSGKVVVRDFLPGTIPMAVFFAVAYYVHDPDRSFDYTGNYERDWVGAGQLVTDLQQADDSDAAGLVFVHQHPVEDVDGEYVPYNGVFWNVPALYVGVDQGQQLKDADGSMAELSVEAERTPNVPTRTLLATLAGQSEERIAIASHTDGMNAVWDNGPIGILALAEYFASLPLECRPRTVQFAFTTAHLYLSQIGAGRYAETLDDGYDEGSVAFAVALEHLGAKEWVAEPREAPLPGTTLKATGESELFAVFVHESPVTLQAVLRSVIERDLRRTWVLRGADAPQVAFPPHRSYGGEGGPYHEHLIPTVAAITGPATLFKPAFTQEQLLDTELMLRQTMAFGDVVLRLGGVPREVIAGADTLYRVGRDATEEPQP